MKEVERVLCEVENGGGFEGDTEKVVDQRNQQSHAPLHLACAMGNM